jgi:CheY-like chemotaxis protein
VVDDDPTFRRLARLLLADLGFVVVAEAGSVADALSTALRVKPSRVLVNVELPDGDGFELAGRLSAMTWSPRSSRRRRTAVRSQPWLRSGAS